MLLRFILRRSEIRKLFLQVGIEFLVAQYLCEVVTIVGSGHFLAIAVSRADIMEQLNPCLSEDLLES